MKRFSMKSKHFGIVILTIDDVDAELLRRNVWTCSGSGTPQVARRIAGIVTCLSHVIMSPASDQYVSHKNGFHLDFRKENLEIKTRKNAKAALA